jgi:hypothetical protein
MAGIVCLTTSGAEGLVQCEHHESYAATDTVATSSKKVRKAAMSSSRKTFTCLVGSQRECSSCSGHVLPHCGAVQRMLD